MKVVPAGDKASVLEWSSRFEPAPGFPEEKAKAIIKGVYEGGIASIRQKLGA